MTFKQLNSFYLYLRIIALTIFISVFSVSNLFASDNEEQGEFTPGDMIMHHIKDAHSWHFFEGATIYLPVILYSDDRGIEIFSSANFYNEEHQLVPYKGYVLEHEHIVPLDESRSAIDFSITKNVVAIILGAIIMIIVFMTIANRYKKNPKSVPNGIQSLLEPVILFVRDDIAKSAIGPKYKRYLPYLLTVFFFILLGNLFGLVPGSANLTGNIAITFTLAIFTLLLTVFSGNKYYWNHIFNTPGVPKWLLPIIVMVEIIGIFTKPFALMIRLFVAIAAGHIVLLSLLSLIFIFESYLVGVVSVLSVAVISFIEILVAAIQAYVFTLLSAIYIGGAVAEHHDDHSDDKALV